MKYGVIIPRVCQLIFAKQSQPKLKSSKICQRLKFSTSFIIIPHLFGDPIPNSYAKSCWTQVHHDGFVATGCPLRCWVLSALAGQVWHRHSLPWRISAHRWDMGWLWGDGICEGWDMGLHINDHQCVYIYIYSIYMCVCMNIYIYIIYIIYILYIYIILYILYIIYMNGM